MQLRFISASYTNNTYNPYEFWRYIPFPLGIWAMQDGTEVEYNFTADDGIAYLIVNNSDMDYRGKTHMLVPSLHKIYEISGYEYENNKQTKLILMEDAFIASFPIWSYGKNIYINRSNSPTTFKGIHDINNPTLEYTTYLRSVGSSQDVLGPMLLVTLETSADVIIEYGEITSSSSTKMFESVANLATLLVKYPEATTGAPNLFPYFTNVVWVEAESALRQCVYTGTKLEWVTFVQPDFTVPSGSVLFNFGGSRNAQQSTKGDVPTITLLVPFNSRIKYRVGANSYNVPSAYNFIYSLADSVLASRVLSMRVVDMNLIPTISNVTYDSVNKYHTITLGGDIQTALDDTPTTWASARPSTLAQDKPLSFSVPTDTYTEYEPFVEYTISIYGNIIPINRKYLNNNLRLRTSISSTDINYTLYNYDISNVISKGYISTTCLTATDKFQEFLAQNSEYRMTKNANIISGLLSRVGTGAISGTMAGGPFMAAVGGSVGLISTATEAINMSLQETAMRNSPDAIRGDSSSVNTVLNNVFGIFLFRREPTILYSSMLNDIYRFKGHPTNMVVQYQTLTTGPVTVEGKYAILIYGEIKTIIRNKYVTDFINEKLSKGVIMLYDTAIT